MVGLFSAQSTAFCNKQSKSYSQTPFCRLAAKGGAATFADISSFAFFNARFEATVIFFDGVCAADVGLLRRA